MAVKKNKHGLQRTIPANIEREVRKRCAFGCVICGKAPYQYDHFNPEFKHAREHNPDGITLLCYEHHGDKTARRINNTQVAAANAAPYSQTNGSAYGKFYTAGNQPIVKLGNSSIEHCEVVLELCGDPVIWFSSVQDVKEGFRLNAKIRDRAGKVIFWIDENVWRIGSGIWDVTIIGPRITIRSKHRRIELVLTIQPPGMLIVERAVLFHRGQMLEILKNGDMVFNSGRFSSSSAMFCHTGIRITEQGNFSFGCRPPKPKVESRPQQPRSTLPKSLAPTKNRKARRAEMSAQRKL